MTTLFIDLPDILIEKSQTLAQQKGISYTDFIHQAIINEIEQIEKYKPQQLPENKQLDSTLTQPTFANKWVGKFKLFVTSFYADYVHFLTSAQPTCQGPSYLIIF